MFISIGLYTIITIMLWVFSIYSFIKHHSMLIIQISHIHIQNKLCQGLEPLQSTIGPGTT